MGEQSHIESKHSQYPVTPPVSRKDENNSQENENKFLPPTPPSTPLIGNDTIMPPSFKINKMWFHLQNINFAAYLTCEILLSDEYNYIRVWKGDLLFADD